MQDQTPYPTLAHGLDVHDPAPPPYDIVGDIHGCLAEFHELLALLGYRQFTPTGAVQHPQGRLLVFVGDLNDRGPASVATWQLALASIAAGTARFVPGNHDSKFTRYLQGRPVQLTHGLAETVAEYLALPCRERDRFRHAVLELMTTSPPYRVFDDGRLVVAHAGLEEWMIGQVDSNISRFARWGDPTGDVNEYGHPVRRDWAAGYTGRALVVYGHTPAPVAEFRNNTIDIDTGCSFGGSLTALRYPELELVSVPAHRVYATPSMAERYGPLLRRAAD